MSKCHAKNWKNNNGVGIFFKDVIKFLDVALIKHNVNKAKLPKPNLQTDTSTPEISESLTKNLEIARQQTPKSAEK